MKTEVLGQEETIVRVKVEFEPGEFKTALDATLREIAQKANIPGFRKGHTPRKILEMRFGKDNLHSEALEKILPNAVEQIIGDYELDVLAPPSLKMDDIQEGQPVVGELTFEVIPEVTLPELEDIEVEKLAVNVTDEMVEEMVGHFRTDHSTLNAVERPVTENDVVSVTFTAKTLDSDTPDSDDEQEKSDIDLSNTTTRAEIKNVLVGKSKGEHAEVEFDVESEHPNESVAGKKVRYDFTIDEVKERVLPELNPEFFKKVLGKDAEGNDIETEEAFRAELKKRLRERMENESLADAGNRAINAIVEKSSCPIPASLVSRQVDFLKKRDSDESVRRYGKEMDEVLQLSSVSSEEYDKSIRERAEESVCRSLVLDAIGKKNEIEVQKEEFDEEINRRAGAYGIDPAQLRAFYFKNNSRLSELSDELRFGKVNKLILEKIKIKEVEELSPSTEEAVSETTEKE